MNLRTYEPITPLGGNAIKLRNTYTFQNSAYLDRLEKVLRVLRFLTYFDKVLTI